MASTPKSRLGDLFRSCFPRARTRTSSDPSSLSLHVNHNAQPTGGPSTQVTPTASIPLGPITNNQATKTEPSLAIATLKTVLEGLRSSLNGLPPLQLAVGGLLECIVPVAVGDQSHQAYNELAGDLTNLATLLQKHVVDSKPRYVPYSIANVGRSITEQTSIIQEHQNRSKIGRLALGLEDEEAVLKCYRRIGALFEQLQADISLSIWGAMREQQMDTRLKDLSPVHDAYYNAALPTTAMKRLGCTEHTRVEILDTTRGWSRERDGPKIFWLNGMAGTGKTTIAYTLCKILQKDNQLGGSFFCSRNLPHCRDVNRIVPTIAYQLGRYSNPYRQALCSVLDGDPDIGKRDISTQFEYLISKPLAEVGKAMPTDIVVVIDALDECEDMDGTQGVLNLLLRHAGSLPIKFFVSSRPEPSISDSMMTSNGAMPSILRLHDIERSLVQADIQLYLAEALGSIQITVAEISQLAEQSGSLFIFAATAVRYIMSNKGLVDHKQRLRVVLKLRPSWGNKSYEGIDKLYATILSTALDPKTFEEAELEQRQQVLWTVVCAREPLTIAALAEVLHTLEVEAVQRAILPLQSVLHISETTSMVSPLHASFPDFLSSKERAGPHYCDATSHESYLAECCFKLMDRSLRFNICDLESSYEFDSDIKDLQDRVAQNIFTGLFYACRYWSDHLTRNSPSPQLLLLLESFLQSRLLFWMEVLNLKRLIGHGENVLSQVLAWVPTQDENIRLRDFAYDARNFLTAFAGNPTSLSTPHIYLSALPFASKQSLVHATYQPQTHGLIQVKGAVMDTGRKSALATWEVPSSVNSLALSNDGRHVASGFTNSEVSVWDISSGTCILGPLAGHEHPIWSVAYSWDNSRIASGSLDNTICIWDAHKGSLSAGPLRGHTETVLSVAFSPDGACLASGSHDQTVRIWDAWSGTPIGLPVNANQGAVFSIAFSPDGERLAAGSDDSTIRVWDWKKSTMAQGQFEGHTGAVHAIAYSSDGLRLVSGSRDRTIRVWNSSSGTLLAGPFEGHTGTVSCVSFSPDGARVVSGSYDSTILVWDAVSGRLVAEFLVEQCSNINSVLFTADGTRIVSGSSDGTIRVWDLRHGGTSAIEPSGQTGLIHSVALSTDGTRVASGSHDCTICVWDTQNSALVAGPFEGHTSFITSVAFSPDGARIASGSHDYTLRTWDASTGALLLGPLEGHTFGVQSVAFSPDGSQIASGSGDCTVRFWNSHTGESVVEPFKGHTEGVTSIAFSPDGTCIVSGSFDDTIRMWDVKDGTTLWTSDAHTKDVYCVAFSPDGTRVVSSSNDCTILVLNGRDGAVLHGPFTGHTSSVRSVTFSPDGTRIVSGSYDETVRVWDVESGTTVAGPLKGHTGVVSSIAFSPDGARVISAGATVWVWDLAAVAQASPSDDWSIDENGWLTNSQSQRLFWVPPDLRARFGLLTASNPIVINADCTTRITQSTLMGDRWRDCWGVSLESDLS